MNNYDSISCMNLYSKTYRLSYKETESAFEDFIGICRRNILTLKGNIFYSINRGFNEEDIEIEIYFPTSKQEKITDGKLKFRNYFMIEGMLSVVVENNPRENMPKAYNAIIKTAEEREWD